MKQAPPYINDQWTLEIEELGFDRPAWELARMVLHCHPPFAICVAGRWGSGKTSLMRYVATLLGGERTRVRVSMLAEDHEDTNFNGSQVLVENLQRRGEEELYKVETAYMPLLRVGDSSWEETMTKGLGRVATLWFSPWRFQNEPSPMVPLLHSLRAQLSSWAKAHTAIGKSARVAIEAGLELLGRLADMATKSVTGLDAGLEGMPRRVRALAETFETANLDRPTDAERFTLLFEAAIHTILGATSEDADDKHRLVVFVDDLDRCDGATSLKLLEAIKLYLSTRYCVFVFGLDVTAAISAIGGLWSGKHRGLAKEYLDKLFQTYVHMPSSNRYPIFIHNRLAECRLQSDKKLDSDAHIANVSRPAAGIARLLPPNPRKVKNFLNSLRLAWQTFTPRLDDKELLPFAVVQRLRSVAPATYTFLCQDPESHLPSLETFFHACLAGMPIERGDDAHGKLILLHDFGHLAKASDDWHRSNVNPLLTLDELHVRLDSLESDKGLVNLWLESQFTASRFRTFAGLSPQHSSGISDHA